MEKTVNTWFVYRITMVAAVGGLLFGYDTAVIAGAIGFLQANYNLSPAMMGWIASCAIVGCMVGALFAGALSDRVGRKKVLMLSAVLFAVSSIGTAMPPSLSWFVAFRLVGGLGIGIASILAPMYITEIAPAAIRGRLVSINQLGIVTGILLIYFVNAGIAGLYDEAWNVSTGWRWMFGSGIIPSAVFMLLLLFVPESPRWLAKQGYVAEPLAILTKINGEEQARVELAQINSGLSEEAGTVGELFGPALRKPLTIGLVLAVLSQITGINAIMYYAPEIFKSTGDGSDSALLQTILVGTVNLLFTIVAIKYVDKWGRKGLLLVGSAGMAVCLLIIGGAFYLEMVRGYVVLVFILAYIAFFAVSLGPLAFVIIAEIFPTRTRGLAMSLCLAALWVSVYLVSQFFPILLQSIGSAYTFWTFMVLSALTFVFVWKAVPETKGRTLEEIEHSWADETAAVPVPTRVAQAQ
jgi:SP family arabinose:H+ symporter-like MFS transporter